MAVTELLFTFTHNANHGLKLTGNLGKERKGNGEEGDFSIAFSMASDGFIHVVPGGKKTKLHTRKRQYMSEISGCQFTFATFFNNQVMRRHTVWWPR